MEQKLKDICKWLKNVKGITSIDINDLVEYLPEYDEWAKEWCADKVKCDLCGHGWVAVYHVDSDHLECPNCHNMTIITPQI
jgi:hypothetical protein